MIDHFTPAFFRRLQQLKIRTRKLVLGSRQGAHRSARRGHGLEFADYRGYAPGDDFRHIDWRVFARTDRLYVREFREERDLQLLILIDGSGSMREKFSFASDLGLALAYVGLADGDSVRIVVLGQNTSPRYSGPRAFARIRKFLSEMRPQGEIDLNHEIRRALALGSLPGKCFFISDFLTPIPELLSSFDAIRGKNYDLSLLQVLTPAELKPDFSEDITLLVDHESGEELPLALDSSHELEYGKALALHLQAIEYYGSRNETQHLVISTDEDLATDVLTRFQELKILQ